MTVFITVENSLSIWRAANLARGDAGSNFISSTSPARLRARVARCTETDAEEVRRDEEDWLMKTVREAYERNMPHPPVSNGSSIDAQDHQGATFVDEVSRWCLRRLDEVLIHFPPSPTTTVSVSVDPAAGPDNGDGGNEDEDELSEDVLNPYAVEDETLDAFWKEMCRLMSMKSRDSINERHQESEQCVLRLR